MNKCVACNGTAFLNSKADKSIWYCMAHGLEYVNIMKIKESEK